MDLPNEILIDIATCLDKQSDQTHLVLINKRMINLKIPLLYSHIMVQHAHNRCASCLLDRLAVTLRDGEIPLGPVVQSLRVNLISSECNEDHRLSNILQSHMTSLKSIDLIAPTYMSRRGLPQFSPSLLWRGLTSVSGTLEHLTICLGGSSIYTDGSRLGNLKGLKALKSLCIQGHVLLGNEDYGRIPDAILKRVLPQGLQHFLMHCYSRDKMHRHIIDIGLNYVEYRGKQDGAPCQWPSPSGFVGPIARGTMMCMMQDGSAQGHYMRSRGERFVDVLIKSSD